MLCFECEQAFHKNGEDWTLAHYARASRVFPLRDVLLPHTAQKLVDDLHYYSCVGIPEVNVEALCYFALSIVWRAAQRPWTLDEIKIDQLELGPHYSEAFRRYLLHGASHFPGDVAVFACVSSLTDVPLIATLPQSRNWGDYRCHFFSIPGLTFTVNVGKRMPDYIRWACLYRGPGQPLFYTPLEDMVNMRDWRRLIEMRTVST